MFTRQVVRTVLNRSHPRAQCSASLVIACSHWVQRVLMRMVNLTACPSVDQMIDAMSCVLIGNLQVCACREMLKTVNAVRQGRRPKLVPHIKRQAVQMVHARNLELGPLTQVALAALAEYLLQELLELAGKVAQERRCVRVTKVHLDLAIQADNELAVLV